MRKSLFSLFLLTCFYLLWPYIAVFSLYICLQTGDAAGVEERVDWFTIKKYLRVDLDNFVSFKLKESLKQNKIKMNFDSLTLSKQISDKISTPTGLIYLFNKPNEFIEQISQIFSNALSPENIKPPLPKKKAFSPEGPNFLDLFDKIKFVFFIKPDRFRLSFNEGDLSFTLEWQLQGLFWKLIQLKIPIKKN